MCCDSNVISQVKIIASLKDAIVENGLSFQNGRLRLGTNPLIVNTDITGGFTLNLGSTMSRLRELNINASAKAGIEVNNDIVKTSLIFTTAGITLADTTLNPKGIVGAGDYSANYTSNTYIQKIYADSRIVGKQLTAILIAPTVTQDGYAIVWNNTQAKFDLAPAGSITAGTNTQIIFNNSGSLAGSANMTFVTDTLSVTNINLGQSGTSGIMRLITAAGNSANINVFIKPKGNTANVYSATISGRLIMGDLNISNTTIQALGVDGTLSLIDLALEPKGSEGVVYIGNGVEVGGYRYLGTRGNSTDINLQISAKGAGTVNLNSTTIYVGNPISTGDKKLLSLTSGTSNLVIGGKGIASIVFIGDTAEAATVRTLQAGSTDPNCNFNILAGTNGTVFINGRGSKEIALPSWNMQAVASIPVTHGIADFTKILRITVIVRTDNGANRYQFNDFGIIGGSLQGYIGAITATTIDLSLTTGSQFASAPFSATGFSRGTMFIDYKL